MSLTLKSTITAKIGFASHQNSVPVVRELEVVNEGETALENLVLELSSDPPFLETKSWRIDALREGSTLHITDRDVKLHAGSLADLTESVSGEAKLRLMKGDEVLASRSHPVVETTLITHSPVPGFGQAVEQGKRQLTDEDFNMAVDIRRARMQRIRPLALSGSAIASQISPEGTATQPVCEALEEAPNLPAFDVEITPETMTPADKVALWQRKLLDLTTRNRLLHMPEKSKGVPLLCPAPGILEDRLADGKKIKVVAAPDMESGGRDAALYAQQNRENPAAVTRLSAVSWKRVDGVHFV